MSLVSADTHCIIFLFFFFFQAEDGIRDKLVTGVQTCALPIYQIENAMLALAVGREAGADPARAVPGLAAVQLPGGRGTVIERGGLTILDDTYNANPASLAWAVKFAHWLAGRRRRPLAVVVGSMLELGGESDRLRSEERRVGKECRSRWSPYH